MKYKIFFISFIFLLTAKFAFSQKEANFWHFGVHAGLDFNSGTPVPFSGSMVDAKEGTASISDTAGNLLFYTDGVSVWNKNNVQMPNGFGLLGNSSSTQSALIVKKPGSENIFYIFTTSNFELILFGGSNAPTPICYSVVDMNLNGGLGNVTTKNVVLYNKSCEKLTGTLHCNKKDIWVITRDLDAPTFSSFLVTSAGINSNPVKSNVGNTNMIGCMKVSLQGNRIASANTFDNNLEIFDFDNSSGIVSNKIFINYSGHPYGIEFSPDGTKLYVSNQDKIDQFNLNAGSPTAIINSAFRITDYTIGLNTGALQLGPDNKIYHAIQNSNYISVINNPNVLGAGCNFVAGSVYIGSGVCIHGLPNFLWTYLKEPAPITPVTDFSYISPVCKNATNPVPDTVSGFTNGGTFTSSPAGLSIDPITGVVNLSQSNAGTYCITYSYVELCVPLKSSTTPLVINQIVPILGFSYPDICVADNTPTSPDKAPGFTSDGTYIPSASGLAIDSEGVIDGKASIPGTYTVTYSVIGSSTLCTESGSDSAIVTIYAIPNISISPETSIYLGKKTTLHVTGGGSYLWSPSNSLSCDSCDSPIATPIETTTYCVDVTLGCTTDTCVKINVEIPCESNLNETNQNIHVPNAFSPNNDGINDQFCLQGWAKCLTSFEINIYDRWGEKVFSSHNPDFCWDGNYQGKVLDQVVFAYFIKASFADSGETPSSPPIILDIQKPGNITLIR